MPAPIEVRRKLRRDTRPDGLLFMSSTLTVEEQETEAKAHFANYKTLISKGFSRRK
jgi:hypothetical protein